MSAALNSDLKPTLRPYQREDVNFLKKLNCAACFNEPRTGKTPTSITALIERGLYKSLIVCPNSAMYQWASEYLRWSDGLSARIVTGTPKRKENIVLSWTNGALILSYDSLKETKKSNGLVDLILKQNPDSVILDEAHRIKNPKSANAQAAFKLTKIPYRLALTGTPAPNKPHEIWSILHYLYPEHFPSYWNFINEFFYSRVVNLAGHSYKEIGGIKASKMAELQNILNSIATQRKRSDVMPWLPEKDKQPILLDPTKEQIKYLDELSQFFETEHIITQGVLDRLIRYRQICLCPQLLGLNGKSPKLEWIKQYLEDYPERPTIVFSKFTSFLHILDEELAEFPHRMIIGDTPVFNRNEYVQEFQTNKVNLLLINIDAGKEALTLDAAEAIIFTDKYPPIGDIEQAEDRFVATTEARANKPHIIYELIMQGTYDAQLYDLIEKRAEAIDAINNFKAYIERRKTNGR